MVVRHSIEQILLCRGYVLMSAGQVGSQQINMLINTKISCVNSTVKIIQWENVTDND